MVILFSGGVDSTAVAWEHRHLDPRPVLLFVDFGQPAMGHELAAARAVAAALRMEIVETEAYLSGAGRMHLGEGKAGPRVMPGRNLALLSIAISLAASRGLSRVQFGAILDDQQNYPDCRPEFVQALRVATEVAYGVRIDAPFLHLRKAEVMARLPSEILALTWSCYEARDERPCGTCDSCRLRDGT